VTTQATDTAVVGSAEAAVRELLHPSIYNHTKRVLHLATHLALGEQVDDAALAVAALFHDSGTASAYDGPQRFELEGADAAARFLQERGWTPSRIRPVWEAIALHTSAGIAERFGRVQRLLREAVLVDLGRAELRIASTPELEQRLSELPRLDIDRVLPDAVVRQALRPGAAEGKAPPFTWPGALVADRRTRP
jgi:hypothetical protein